VLLKYAKLDVPLAKLPALGALARRLDPARLKNVVAPGRLGFTARQSVVFLTNEAARLFEDLRPDAVVGSAEGAPASSSSSSSTTAPGRSSHSSGRSSTTTSSPPSTTTTSPGESTTSTTDNSGTPVTLVPDR
jgi:hypothetical protein